MLSFFRRGGTGQVVIGAIVVAIIVVFVVEFRAQGGSRSGKLQVECAARVYGTCVTQKEYEGALRLAAGGAEQKQQARIKLPQLILEGLVERELLLREAARLGIGITEDEIDDELEAGRVRVSLPAQHAAQLSAALDLCQLVPHPFFLDARRGMNAICSDDGPYGVRIIPVRNSKTNQFDYEIYRRNIGVYASRSPKEFKKMQRRELVAERMRELIRSQVVVSENAVYAAYERENSKVVARTATIQRDWFAKYVVQVTDAVLEDWIADHKEEVEERWKGQKEQWKEGCPLVSEIRVRFAPAATDAEKVVLRGKIDAALARLKDGEDFSSVARETSDGPAAVVGGAVGCLDADNYGPAAEEVTTTVVGLKPGAHTGVVETPVGFHIFRLDGLLPASDVEGAAKRYVARDLAVRFKADGEARSFADSLIAELKAGKEIEAATKALVRSRLLAAAGRSAKGGGEELAGVDAPDAPRAEVSAPFTRYGAPIGGDVAALVFDLKNPGDVYPKPVDMENGFLVIQLKEKLPAKREDFQKEKLELMRLRQRVKANEALADYVAALRKQAESKIELDPDLLAQAKNDGDGEQPKGDAEGENEAEPSEGPEPNDE